MWIRGIKKWENINPEATYLLLVSPQNIPHLVLVSKNVYYSLTHKKSVVDEPVQPYLKFLQRSGKSVLIAELRVEPLEVSTIFGRYQKANTAEITCLLPIREAVLPNSSANFVFELIPELLAQDLIRAFYQVNMDDLVNQTNDFELSTYSKEAIFSYIESLNEKYAKRD